ncbi:hypothetical protein DFH09DRAFT_1312696 [Mycena vulgaris]|nr:hypothetical protein DFH09DRAFT_1312696 [Mycena vulgaris]
MIPDSTQDSSPEGFFFSEWTEDDAAWLNDHIRKHSLARASGEDAVLYAEIIDIPNDVLVLLCNECIRKKGWAYNSEHYRIIALESCILKVLTLLIHKRITDWAKVHGHIPDYQNGFREGYGTKMRTTLLSSLIYLVRAWTITMPAHLAAISPSLKDTALGAQAVPSGRGDLFAMLEAGLDGKRRSVRWDKRCGAWATSSVTDLVDTRASHAYKPDPTYSQFLS